MENENVLILGLGGVGMHLTKRLSNEGHAVTVIETDPYLIRQASEQLDVRIVSDNSMQLQLWEHAQLTLGTCPINFGNMSDQFWHVRSFLEHVRSISEHVRTILEHVRSIL